MVSKVVPVCRNSSSAALLGSAVATIFLFMQAPIQALPAALRLNTPVQATSVDEKDEVGFTPLIHALHDEQTGEVESLLKKGADPNAKDNFGWAALIHAVSKNDSRALAHLLSNGADVNIKDNRGMTALMWAAMQGREKIIKALLDHGAEINATASNGATALAFAQSKREGGAAKIIREAGGTGRQIDSSSVPKNVVSPLDTGPKPLNRVPPKYTPEALSRGVQGVVRLRLLIGADGTVKSVKIIAGLPYGLTEEAVTHASKLKFNPALYEGRPVAYWFSFELAFSQRADRIG